MNTTIYYPLPPILSNASTQIISRYPMRKMHLKLLFVIILMLRLDNNVYQMERFRVPSG